MTTIKTTGLKVVLPFKAGELPAVDPGNPVIQIVLGEHRITAKINAKSARKLAVHPGGAVLQGKLIVEGGKLVLAEAGFQFLDPRTATDAAKPAAAATEPQAEEGGS
jgi:hypothetical protein